jgi:hypothetical protein
MLNHSTLIAGGLLAGSNLVFDEPGTGDRYCQAELAAAAWAATSFSYLIGAEGLASLKR